MNPTSGVPRDWNWSDFDAAATDPVDSVRLSRNGWQALVAYLAGPARVTSVPEETRLVRVSSSGHHYSRAQTTFERSELESDLNAYLAEAGVPQPPLGVEWRLTLPEGVSEQEFWSRIEQSIRPLQRAQYRPGDLFEPLRTAIDSLFASRLDKE